MIVLTVALVDHAIAWRWRWDRHLFPLPGSHIVVFLDTPIETQSTIAPSPTVEDLRLSLAHALRRLGREARIAPD